VAILLLLVAMALLGVFLWTYLKPETVVKGAKPETFSEVRSQAVETDRPAPPAPRGAEGPAAAEAPAAHAAPAQPAATGPLCDTLLDASSARALSLPPGRTIKKGPAVRSGAWTWVSLWAAWCKPCKEEMPLLSDWAGRLRSRGAAIKATFLSVDDDERQLSRYMAAQGQGIFGDFLWVHDEAARARFYDAIGVKNPPTLPVQVILDPAGRLRCVRVGSISQKELDEATRTFGW
jgi:thiol-disulfide isomerase/thioredoxin